MNLPNKLTIIRVLLVPVFMALFLIESIPYNLLWAFVVFVIASLTDAIDGYIARKNNLITDFGKFLDPLADKVLVIAALACFVQVDLTNAAILMIIIAREFLVTSLRLVVVSSNGKVIAASVWGKWKTISQMVSIVVILLTLSLWDLNIITEITNKTILVFNILLWISAGLTVISGLEYLSQNIQHIDPKK